MTVKSKIVITNKKSVNGCVALAWCLGCYDYDNMAFLQDVLKSSSDSKTFFDIGANIGVYSLLASENERTKVIAFEPHPVTAELLIHNLKENDRKNVEVVRGGLSNTTEHIGFTNNPGSPINRIVHVGSSEKNLIQIPIERGEDFCKSRGLIPSIVKIDVEGHEIEVLEGFGPLIENIQILIIEENLPAAFIKKCLPSIKFSSFYVDYNNKILSGKSSAWRQDVIYVNNEYLPSLLKLGYTVIK